MPFSAAAPPRGLPRGRLSPIAEFFVLSSAGYTLLQHTSQKEDVIRGIEDMFYRRVVREALPPVFLLHGASVAWVKRDSLLFMCYSRHNASPALLMEALSSVHYLIAAHVGGDPSAKAVQVGMGMSMVGEREVKANQPLLYELLEEIIVDGTVATTDQRELANVVENRAQWHLAKSWRREIAEGRWVQHVPRTGIAALDRRKEAFVDALDSDPCVSRPLLTDEGGKDAERRGEVFIDVVESVDAHFHHDGAPRVGTERALGEISYKAYVRGAPVCTLSLGEVRLPGDDVARRGGGGAAFFSHHSIAADVREEDWRLHRRLLFPLSPGEHSVLRYEVRRGVTLPFMLCSGAEYPDEDTMVITVKVRAVFDVSTGAAQVTCRVPVPKGHFEPVITYGLDKVRSKEGHSTKVLESLSLAERSRVHRGDATHRVVLWTLGTVSAHDPEHVLSVTCKRPPSERRPAAVFKGCAELRFLLIGCLATPVALGDGASAGGGTEGCDIARSAKTATPQRFIRRVCRQGSYTLSIEAARPHADDRSAGAGGPPKCW